MPLCLQSLLGCSCVRHRQSCNPPLVCATSNLLTTIRFRDSGSWGFPGVDRAVAPTSNMPSTSELSAERVICPLASKGVYRRSRRLKLGNKAESKPEANKSTVVGSN